MIEEKLSVVKSVINSDLTANMNGAELDTVKIMLEKGSEFTAMVVLDVNEKISVSQILQISIISKVMIESGGKLIVFIDDLGADLKSVLNRRKDQIAAMTKYMISLLNLYGITQDNSQIIVGSTFSLNNFELFTRYVVVSTRIPVSEVQNRMPRLSKSKADSISASTILSPVLLVTQIMNFKPNLVFTSSDSFPLISMINNFEEFKNVSVLPLRSVLRLKCNATTLPEDDPAHSFFFYDTPEVIKQKCLSAFCTDDIANNPVFDYVANLVLPTFHEFILNGKKYENSQAVIEDFAKMDKKSLKLCLHEYVVQVISKISQGIANVYQNWVITEEEFINLSRSHKWAFAMPTEPINVEIIPNIDFIKAYNESNNPLVKEAILAFGYVKFALQDLHGPIQVEPTPEKLTQIINIMKSYGLNNFADQAITSTLANLSLHMKPIVGGLNAAQFKVFPLLKDLIRSASK